MRIYSSGSSCRGGNCELLLELESQIFCPPVTDFNFIFNNTKTSTCELVLHLPFLLPPPRTEHRRHQPPQRIMPSQPTQGPLHLSSHRLIWDLSLLGKPAMLKLTPRAGASRHNSPCKTEPKQSSQPYSPGIHLFCQLRLPTSSHQLALLHQ